VADPEQLYQEVLAEEQQKGSSAPVAEGRAKAARQRAIEGSPHPKEPKWWPGAQPHLEGGDGQVAEAPIEEAPAEEPAEAPAAEEAAPAAEAPAEEAPAEEAPAEEAPAEEAPAPAAAAPAEAPAAAPAEAPAAAPAEAPAAAAPAEAPAAAPAEAPAAAATPTQLSPEQRPVGVSHGTAGGSRLRPEDAVSTETQFTAQEAVYRRRKMIDELVATGVPAATAYEASRNRTSPGLLLVYLLIPLLAIAFLLGQRDELAGSEGGGGQEQEGGGGGGGLTVSAQNVQFDTDSIELPPNREAELTFVNDDASATQHNISIYETPDAEENLFEGQIIPGGQEVTYSIPALEPGDFYFQCDVHPSMNGDVKVG
jgi:plastocyanin